MRENFNLEKPAFYGEKRFYQASTWLKETFGKKTIKLAIDGGFTCPNRDGSKGFGGCTFCSDSGSGEFASNIEDQIKLLSDKWPNAKYLGYFQNHTNTYAPAEHLERVFTEVINRDDIVAISIGTRPDCLPAEILDLLEKLNKIKPVWVELGLQTAKEKSAEYIRRCYLNSVYENAVKELKNRGINVITHIIIGLPNETKDDIFNTVDFAVKCGTDGVKLQLLHILKDTDLYEDFKKGTVVPLQMSEYLDILFGCLERIPENVVIHRITGDAPKKYLVEPLWSADKKKVLNTINREMKNRNIIQGGALK